MKPLNVPFALDENQQLVSPAEAVKSKSYYFPACKDSLVLRQGKIRIFHFSHKATNVCTQVTIIHKTAKGLICQAVNNWKNNGAKVPIVERTCPRCDNKIEQPLPDKVERAQEEFLMGDFHGDVVLFTNGIPAFSISAN